MSDWKPMIRAWNQRGYVLAVLFVRDQSIYKAMGLDCYDRRRDARTFAGAGPVIAHPPCRTWFKSRVPQWEREATPPAFAAWLVELARRCSRHNKEINTREVAK